MTAEELIDAWQWVRDHFNDEMAQRVALRLLAKPPIPGMVLVYAKFPHGSVANFRFEAS